MLKLKLMKLIDNFFVVF